VEGPRIWWAAVFEDFVAVGGDARYGSFVISQVSKSRPGAPLFLLEGDVGRDGFEPSPL